MKNTSKNSYFFLLVSFVVTALLVGTPAYAQDKTGEIDKIFSWAKPDDARVRGRRLAARKAGREPRLRLGRPRARRSDQPEHDLRCRIGEEAVRRRGGPPPRRRGKPFSFRRRPQIYSASCPTTATRSRWTICSPIPAAFATGPGFRPLAGGRSRRADHDPASARPQFRARRGMVLFEQRLCAADRRSSRARAGCRSPTSRASACSSRSG